ncbi:MAG: ACT domain-containing protein [Minisyncoccales bacterium]
MTEKKFTLTILPQKFGICYLDKNTPLPEWILNGQFFFLAKTDQELSIVFPQEKIPGGVMVERDWRIFRLEGVIDGLYAVGIIAALTKPLAEASISVFNVSTYKTNYLLVEEKNLDKAKKVLSGFCQIK